MGEFECVRAVRERWSIKRLLRGEWTVLASSEMRTELSNTPMCAPGAPRHRLSSLLERLRNDTKRRDARGEILPPPQGNWKMS